MTRTDGNNYPEADGDFSNAPYFNFNDGKLKFNTNFVDNPNENYGSASGFLSKSLPKKDWASAKRMPFPLFLPSFCWTNPTAEHAANFIHNAFKGNILFRINCFNIFHEADKNPKHIELQTASF